MMHVKQYYLRKCVYYPCDACEAIIFIDKLHKFMYLSYFFVDHLKMKKIPTNQNSSSAAYHPSHLGNMLN